MTRKDDFMRTMAHGESALANLRKNELAAVPRNYELWYTYSAGFNQSLNKAINEVLRAKGRVASPEMDRIYDQHVSPARIGDRIDEVGGHMSDEIKQVVDMIEGSLSLTSAYSDSLGQASSKLTTAHDRETIHAIVSELVLATKETETANRRLEQQLVESRRQISELQENLEAIRYESLTDELTTLANRKHFDQSMERALTDAEQSGEPFALLMTDIDHFKKFNDTFGHQTGDQVLRLVALAVKQNVKGQDVACRYGGEEFGIILPKTNLRQAVAVAEHIRVAVMSKELIKRSTGENLGRITISIGASSWHRGDNAQTMIERADSGLYAAKRAGRNVVKCETDPDVSVDNKSKSVA